MGGILFIFVIFFFKLRIFVLFMLDLFASFFNSKCCFLVDFPDMSSSAEISPAAEVCFDLIFFFFFFLLKKQ